MRVWPGEQPELDEFLFIFLPLELGLVVAEVSSLDVVALGEALGDGVGLGEASLGGVLGVVALGVPGLLGKVGAAGFDGAAPGELGV